MCMVYQVNRNNSAAAAETEMQLNYNHTTPTECIHTLTCIETGILLILNSPHFSSSSLGNGGLVDCTSTLNNCTGQLYACCPSEDIFKDLQMKYSLGANISAHIHTTEAWHLEYV